MAASKEASLLPSVFSELVSGGYHHCGEDVLSNHLIQKGFTRDGAKKAASVFKANVEFANLSGDDNKLEPDKELTDDAKSVETLDQKNQKQQSIVPPDTTPLHGGLAQAAKKRVLASFSVPIGNNDVQIIFTGEGGLHPSDFDALNEYSEIFKKQLQRKMTAGRIFGTIQSEPRITGETRITFLLSLGDGQVISCLSGAGTKFEKNQFALGMKITLLGGPVAELISQGETAYFVFYDFDLMPLS
jgi:hypothetical protein